MVAVGRFFLFSYFVFIYGYKCPELTRICIYRTAICGILLVHSVAADKFYRLAYDPFSLGYFRYERHELGTNIAQKAVYRFLRMIIIKIIKHIVCKGHRAAVIDQYHYIVGAAPAVLIALHNIAHDNILCNMAGGYYGLGRFEKLKERIHALIKVFLVR